MTYLLCLLGVIFAYGQTSSGKTHSMFGTSSDPGIIPQCIQTIFHAIQESSRVWLLRCSFLEIYNEELLDLLGTDNTGKLKLVEVCQKNLYYYMCHVEGRPSAR